RLAIDVSMPRRVFVRGRGLDSEWAGSFKIGGTAARPSVRGEINSVRGSLDILTHSFTVQPSTIEVVQDTRNAIVAVLDINASSQVSGLEAIVRITGTAAAPEIAFTSNPPRPQDEVLALILFGKTTAQLSAFEAVQLGAAIAQLTGGGGGGILAFARNALGIDVLRVGGAGDGGPTVQAGRYIARDVFVGIEQGTTPGSSAVSVEAEIFRNFSVHSRVKPDGETEIGVKMEWHY
ncbi:MAG: translocation/assembly module TamB domain-containing protein, partial [Alphaproteobacteria bacterium]